MKLLLNNIGKIQKAEIDLEKQLTVFFGPNNTGKTYVSYCLYGLKNSKFLVDALADRTPAFDFDVNELLQVGRVEVDIVEQLKANMAAIKDGMSMSSLFGLSRVLGENRAEEIGRCILSVFKNIDEFEPFFSDINVKFKLSDDGDLYNISCNHSRKGKNEIILEGVNKGVVVNDADKNERLKDAIVEYILRFHMKARNPFNDQFFIPAERLGIAAFGKELALNRLDKTNSPTESKEFISYPSPIFDAIKVQVDLAGKRSNEIEEVYLKLAQELEHDILGGNLLLDERGNVSFNYGGKRDISILRSASTVKSLSSLVFYLRYYARKGQVLIIDEPEINLHPENQVKVARLLVKMVNAGIKVVVSTHSDYIIREFNNLIMLNSEKPERDELMQKYGYTKDELLDKGKVGAYYFHDGVVDNMEVKETGFEMESIDDVINKQNVASSDIMWTLYDA